DDIAQAWWRGLREGARLVVPLRLESAGEYAIGFVRRMNQLVSVGAYPCAFIALRGEVSAPAPSDVFYRDPAQRWSPACVRQVGSVVAVRSHDATPALLDDADVVIARPVTIFAVTFDRDSKTRRAGKKALN
ncbi:MAG TPA: hypothetical protein VIX35_03455, partial [Vicinamibacterales bacterium]